jgi:hypothetical protein
MVPDAPERGSDAWIEAEQAKQKSKNARTMLGYGGLAAVILLGIIGCTAAVTSNAGDSPSNSDNSYEAISQCEARIDRLLKAPGTAAYDSSASGGPSKYVVSGMVDSENSFGGSVRSEYQCQVTVSGSSATTSVDYLR